MNIYSGIINYLKNDAIKNTCLMKFLFYFLFNMEIILVFRKTIIFLRKKAETIVIIKHSGFLAVIHGNV